MVFVAGTANGCSRPDLPVTLSTDRTPKGLLHSDTCRMIYFGNSAEAAGGDFTPQ